MARLSVFPRKFSRTASEKIAGAKLPVLASLMDKSLLLRDSSGYYEMIGVLRRYAEEKVRELSDERNRTLNLFYEYYAEFVNQIKEDLQTGKNINIISEIKAEMDNIRTVGSVIVEQGNEKLIEKALLGMFLIYDTNGWLTEGADSLQRLIDRLEEKKKKTKSRKSLETPLMGKIYTRQATFLYQLGFYDRAKELLNRSLKIAREYENKEEIGACFNTFGNISFMLSQDEESRKMYNAWLEIAKELNHEKNMAGAYNNLGVISYELGEFDKAKELFEKSKVIAEKIGFKKGVALANTNIARVLHETGSYYEGALSLFNEGLKISQDLNDSHGEMKSYINTGRVYVALKDYEPAKNII